MRTKTLLVAAALGAVGVTSAVAQVYSVNAVGYVNKALKTGFNLIANPLDAGATGNTVEKLLAGVPEGTTVYIYTPGTGYSLNTFEFGEWTDKTKVIAPGTGFFISVPSDVTVTFVGEVKQGTLSTPLAAGFNLVASQVPQAGKLTTDLKFTAADGDSVYTYANPAGYSISSFDFGAWDPAEPTIGVADGLWISAASAKSWDRTFSVN
jgi:hypothetical protein